MAARVEGLRRSGRYNRPMRRLASAEDSFAHQSPFSVAAWGLIFLGGFVAVTVVGTAGVEAGSYLTLVTVIALIASVLIPNAASKQPGISGRTLAIALGFFLLGSLARYLIIETIYGGASDARGYFGAGITLSEQFRVQDFSGLIPPFTDTNAIDYFSGFLYMILPPSQLAGFVVSAGMSFIGSWHFYKAFVLAFPQGDRRLFALLIFFLPSFWYWTTSLGKDAPVMMGLGIATYGFAVAFKRMSLRGVMYILLGLIPVAIVRAPIAAAVGIAGMGAYALRPTRARSAHAQALSYIVFLPVFALGMFLLINQARNQIGALADPETSIQAAFETQQEANLTGGSNFTPPNPFSPLGLPLALVTANFRPFPFEAGGFFPVLQSLEGVFLLGLLVLKRRAVWHSVRNWRHNAMTIMAAASILIISVELASLANFGLLARQRTQVLPFLLMVPCMVKIGRSRKKQRASEGSAPFPAWASASAS